VGRILPYNLFPYSIRGKKKEKEKEKKAHNN
jgi:hypothetical protein